jgi:hypothetical protein
MAQAWLTPAKVRVAGVTFRSEGYDPSQRAFAVSRQSSAANSALELTIEASSNRPIVNPAIVVKNWGEADPFLKINGRPTAWGKDFRYGLERNLNGTNLVVWMQEQSTTSLQLTLAPKR